MAHETINLVPHETLGRISTELRYVRLDSSVDPGQACDSDDGTAIAKFGILRIVEGKKNVYE